MLQHPHEPSTPATTLTELALTLLRWRRLIAGIALVAFAVSASFVVGQRPRYRAVAQVLVTSDRANVSTSAERPTALVRTSQVADAEINSQVEILRGQALVGSVLEHLPPEPGARLDAPATSEADRAWVRARQRELVMKNLTVTRLRNSTVIAVAYAGTDAGWARDFVNALTTAYVERHAALKAVGEAESFFTQQSELLRAKLTASEQALREVRERAGALAGQQVEVHARLNEFSAELARARVAQAEQEQRVGFLERLTGPGGVVATPELLALEAKRAELAGRYQPDSERLQEVDGQIRRLRVAIAAYGGIGSAGGAEGQGATGTTDLRGARTALAAARARTEALSREETTYRRQAELLDAQSFDLTRLERQVNLDEDAYVSYVKAAEEARLSSALDKSKLLRLTIVEPATAPIEPEGPRRLVGLVWSALGALVLACAVAWALSQLRGVVYAAADVRRHTGLPVLASIPRA